MSSITMYIVYTSKYHTNNKGVYTIYNPKKRTLKKTNEHSEHEHLCSICPIELECESPKNFELRTPRITSPKKPKSESCFEIRH